MSEFRVARARINEAMANTMEAVVEAVKVQLDAAAAAVHEQLQAAVPKARATALMLACGLCMAEQIAYMTG